MSECKSRLERRVSRLERTNRMFLVGLVAICAVAVGAGSSEPDLVRARGFQLLGPEGSARAELAFHDGSPGLFITDVDGNDRLLLTHDTTASALFIRDEDGTIRIGIAQFTHGGGGVALHGPDSKGAAVLSLKGQGSLRFFDTEGNVTNEVTAAPAPEAGGSE